MDSLPAIFATSFFVALSGALMPGPMLTLTVAEAARTGWKSGPMVVLGHGVLELLLLLLVVLGLGGFLSSRASVKALGLIGGATLVVMGVVTVYGANSAPKGATKGGTKGEEGAAKEGTVPAAKGGTEPATGGASAWAGLPGVVRPGRPAGPSALGTRAGRQAAGGALTSVSNPYWALWWATVGLGYLALAGRMGPAGIGSFFGGHILADLAWYTLVATLVGSGRKMLGGRAYRGLLTACGAFLVVFGAYFIRMGMAV